MLDLPVEGRVGMLIVLEGAAEEDSVSEVETENWLAKVHESCWS
jgi:hypothetical protein